MHHKFQILITTATLVLTFAGIFLFTLLTKLFNQSSENYMGILLISGLIISLVACSIVFFVANKLVNHFEHKIEIQNQKLQQALIDNEAKQTQLDKINEIEKAQIDFSCRQRDDITEKNANITDSIRYAKRIQDAALSKKEIDKSIFSEYFILFMPRDIVSGDFYWYHDFEDQFIVASGDCTGHGVPGAFMSMIGITFLNEIVLDEQVYDAAKILDQMRKDVILALDQENNSGGAQDGMDISICIINKKNRTLQYAGAYQPLIWIRNGVLNEFKGNRMPVGIYGKMNEEFTNHHIEIEKNDVIYLFSDGYADQFGGSKGRKFLINNFKRLLFEIQEHSLDRQKQILQETIIKWKGNNQQVDDISVIGLKIN